MAAGPLVLAVLAYLALDFANPLMPGAVDFVGGSVAGVHAERARPDHRVPAETGPADAAIPLAPRSALLAGRSDREPRPPRRHRVSGRCRPTARSRPVAADDH